VKALGFTLIEMMIAVALLGITAIVGWNAVQGQATFTEAAAARRLAAQALQEEAEQLRAVPAKDLAKGERAFACAECLSRLRAGRGTVAPRALSGGAVELRLRVEWTRTDGARESAELSTIRAPWGDGR
jgi:prepilin-type N-terminal cleavage/methylation domain-containing protein